MTSSVSDAMAKLRSQFAAQLPEKLDSLRAHYQLINPAAWQPAEAEALHRLLHGLTGSAGTFGMPSLSDAARTLENRLSAILKTKSAPTAAEWQDLSADIHHLDQFAHTHLEPNLASPKPHSTLPRLKHAPLIYLVEDELDQAAHLSQALQDNGYRVQVFTTTDEFRTVFTAKDTERPDAVVMDMIISESNDAGVMLMAELKAKIGRCPPVIFSSVRDDLPARLAAFRAGASRYLVKPINIAQMTNLLDDLTGRQPPQPYRVFMVDDDPLMMEAHAEILRAAGMEVYTLTQPLLALEMLNEIEPDVAVLDVYMPGASGPELAAILREREEHMHLPILFLSAETDMSQQLLALNLGGDDFLVKPVRAEHLVAAVTARARRARQNSAVMQRLETTLYEREREHLAVNQHAIVSIANQAGNIIYINDKFSEVSGYSHDELMGHNHRLLKSGIHPPEFYKDLWQTIAGGKVWQGEICNRRKGGSFYWVESTITPFLDSNGTPYQYVSIRTDISHVKAAEISLRESETRLNQAQQLAHIGSFEWNPVSGDLAWSDEHYRLWGYQPNSVTPSFALFREKINPDDLPKLDKALERAINNKEPFDIVYRLNLPDGNQRIMHSRGLFTFSNTGVAILLAGTVQDITERIQAETLLRETEERFVFAVEGAGDGVWDWNMNSNAMTFSRLYMAMLGYVENELPNHADTWTNSVHPDDLGRIRQNLQEYLAGKIQAYHVELRLRCKDGNYKWILCRGKLVERDKSGNPLRMIGIHSDITEGKHNEQLLIVAREEADRANRTKSEFLSSMSHELRTPMNAILGFGQLMNYDDALPDEQKDSVKEILKAGYHLLDLINEVLDLSKVESGNMDLSIEPVQIHPLIEECLSLVKTLADKRDITISYDVPKGTAVRADPMRLRQVLLNLLSNAIKYNRICGSVKLEVETQGSDRLRIKVIDTGQGIPAARLAEVFQPFNRLDAQNSSIEGTGIGLTITRRIVELMGGAVDVESTVGVGSTFWVELPLESMPTCSNSENEEDKIIDDTSMPTIEYARHTVLYIEDNPSNVRLVAQILGKRINIDLLTAHTPELGIELAMSRRPDLILLDINMPNMDGYQVLGILKAEASLKLIPVIAVTANAMQHDIERGIQAGFADYLTKPIDVLKFNEVLKRSLTHLTETNS